MVITKQKPYIRDIREKRSLNTIKNHQITRERTEE